MRSSHASACPCLPSRRETHSSSPGDPERHNEGGHPRGPQTAAPPLCGAPQGFCQVSRPRPDTGAWGLFPSTGLSAAPPSLARTARCHRSSCSVGPEEGEVHAQPTATWESSVSGHIQESLLGHQPSIREKNKILQARLGTGKSEAAQADGCKDLKSLRDTACGVFVKSTELIMQSIHRGHKTFAGVQDPKVPAPAPPCPWAAVVQGNHSKTTSFFFSVSLF